VVDQDRRRYERLSHVIEDGSHIAQEPLIEGLLTIVVGCLTG